MMHNMITSASGWRKVFAASGDENDSSEHIGGDDAIIASISADIFADSIIKKNGESSVPTVIVGRDTRPTGKPLCDAILRSLAAKKITVRYAGITAAPEIMAYARNADGFIYVSASHNPVGHNGIKFGLSDGGVLGGAENASLVRTLEERCASESEVARVRNLLDNYDKTGYEKIIDDSPAAKSEAKDSYLRFSKEVISAADDEEAQDALFGQIRKSMAERPLGVVCDMNGSARTLSIDARFFEDCAIPFHAINGEAGKIAHAIIPEGENLAFLAGEMESLQKAGGKEFTLGYMPDCDGDRGNIVFWNERTERARILAAQEVFALCALSELAYMRRLAEVGGKEERLAVVANCPTSMRVDEICRSFKAEIFRAEVGEANVVGLARKKRGEGLTVRILGEGSNGGNITHPAAVRDPLCTIFALIKLLTLRDTKDGRGLFHLWCDARSIPYKDDFSLADVIETLPAYTTTGVAEERAALRIRTRSHAELKAVFQKIFESEWEAEKSRLSQRYGIEGYEAVGTNGAEERRGLTDYAESGSGGLKIVFFDARRSPLAFIWMRGSGTEPVFRVLCDVRGDNPAFEHELLEWERRMILRADEIISDTKTAK